ncbi:energy transducer TonB [Vibrio coralliilyticus]|uniref:TonB family protein n=1 Tax=Vibrio coralliilyticus TaxID=190893 RepID=UPI000BAC22F4|nr:energy transducer TonB [Vibrio coralliilyticus]NOI78804.1 energy transducer TonB [Vibrio coralliilyticus]PAW00803.1 ferric siderophore ABC transporter substrate-binding protein [Vibrio coralliilyticus]
MMVSQLGRATSHDSFGPWLLPGIVVSVGLHLAIAAYYLYQPKAEFIQPPAAIPVSVALVAPVAAPHVEKPALNNGPEQNESLDSMASMARPEPLEPQQKNQQEVESVPEPTPIVATETQRSSEIAFKPEKPIETKPKTKAESKPVAQFQKQVETPKAETPSVSQQASVAQIKKSAPQLEVDKELKQVQGVSGAFSQHLKQVKVSWKQQLVLHLEQHKQYPRRAKRMRKQGVPLITFTMDRAGQVLGVKLVRSSGTESLDKEAVDLVYRAIPLPLPPDEVSGATLTWTVPVRFYVQ